MGGMQGGRGRWRHKTALLKRKGGGTRAVMFSVGSKAPWAGGEAAPWMLGEGYWGKVGAHGGGGRGVGGGIRGAWLRDVEGVLSPEMRGSLETQRWPCPCRLCWM